VRNPARRVVRTLELQTAANDEEYLREKAFYSGLMQRNRGRAGAVNAQTISGEISAENVTGDLAAKSGSGK